MSLIFNCNILGYQSLDLVFISLALAPRYITAVAYLSWKGKEALVSQRRDPSRKSFQRTNFAHYWVIFYPSLMTLTLSSVTLPGHWHGLPCCQQHELLTSIKSYQDSGH